MNPTVKKRVLISLAFIGLLLISLAMSATSSARPAKRAVSDSSAKTYRMGLVEPDLANPFINAMAKGAQAEAKKLKITLLVTGSNDSTAQVNASETYISSKVDALIINAIDSKAISTAVQDANKAGIPVVSLQAPPASGKTISVIRPSLFLIGKLNGAQILKYCAKINPCQVGLVRGNLADQSGRVYEQGVKSVISKASNIKTVASAPTNYDPVQALNVTANLITAHPNINAFFYPWSQGLLAGVEAVRNAGKTGKIGLFSGSAPCPSLQALLKGDTTGDVMSFPEVEGALSVDYSLASINGKSVPKLVVLPSYPITKAKAEALLSGKIKPPAKLPQVLTHLKQAVAGCK